MEKANAGCKEHVFFTLTDRSASRPFSVGISESQIGEAGAAKVKYSFWVNESGPHIHSTITDLSHAAPHLLAADPQEIHKALQHS